MADKKSKKNEDKEIKDQEIKEEACEAEETDKKEEKAEDAVAKERDMYLEMLRRERADFENYKKRNAALASASFANGSADVIEKILPVLDNFDRALAGYEESEDAFAVGVKMIYRQLMDSLTALGVKEIDALGKAFDPELMNAVMQVEKAEGEESGIVNEVFQKGYKLNDRILRYAMVKVTN